MPIPNPRDGILRRTARGVNCRTRVCCLSPRWASLVYSGDRTHLSPLTQSPDALDAVWYAWIVMRARENAGAGRGEGFPRGGTTEMPGHAPAYSNCSPEGLVILWYDSIGMRARENPGAGRGEW